MYNTHLIEYTSYIAVFFYWFTVSEMAKLCFSSCQPFKFTLSLPGLFSKTRQRSMITCTMLQSIAANYFLGVVKRIKWVLIGCCRLLPFAHYCFSLRYLLSTYISYTWSLASRQNVHNTVDFFLRRRCILKTLILFFLGQASV